MEHVIQFGVSIDDEAIEKSIIANAEKKITSELGMKFEERIFRKRYSYGRDIEELSETGKDIVYDWLKDNSEKIIEYAGNIVAEKVFRSKAWKEKYGEVTADDKD